MSRGLDEKWRAWWSRKQGLDGSWQGRSPAEVLRASGWARSVGGASPYLTLFARAGTTRADADAAVANRTIHELPAVRGCTYVVPAEDYSLALHLGQGADEGEIRAARKLGVTDAELERLNEAVLAALAGGPLEPEELRAATGKAARSLGEEGKKKGLTTTLPLALGRLQTLGRIRRIPVNGRLDQQRYKYALWRPNPLRGDQRSREEHGVELARRFFEWSAPATLAQFQAFSGFGAKAARAAVEPLRLAPLEDGDEALVGPQDRELFQEFRVPKEAEYVLVGSLDSIGQLRRDLSSLVAASDRDHPLLVSNVSSGGALYDLPSHAILDRGRVVGLWEFDVESNSIVWCSFIAKRKALEDAVRRTERFVVEELGDARSFSLDSPKSRRRRIDALRACSP